MKGALALRDPLDTIVLLMSSTNITTSAWVALNTGLLKASNALEIYNPSGQPLLLATGAAGVEVAQPYTVPPGGSCTIIAANLKKGAIISAKTLGATANSGYLIINVF